MTGFVSFVLALVLSTLSATVPAASPLSVTTPRGRDLPPPPYIIDCAVFDDAGHVIRLTACP